MTGKVIVTLLVCCVALSEYLEYYCATSALIQRSPESTGWTSRQVSIPFKSRTPQSELLSLHLLRGLDSHLV